MFKGPIYCRILSAQLLRSYKLFKVYIVHQGGGVQRQNRVGRPGLPLAGKKRRQVRQLTSESPIDRLKSGIKVEICLNQDSK